MRPIRPNARPSLENSVEHGNSKARIVRHVAAGCQRPMLPKLRSPSRPSGLCGNCRNLRPSGFGAGGSRNKPAILADIETSPVPVVIDHMALAKARLGVTQPGFRELLQLVGTGKCWVKVSGAYRVSSQSAGYSDVEPIARTLIAANPTRVIWGTDWPHTAPHAVHAGNEVPVILPSHERRASVAAFGTLVPGRGLIYAGSRAKPRDAL
jgi:hypothetical protein